MPQMAAPLHLEINKACVGFMALPDGFGQCFRGVWNDDQVHVIWHQTVAPDLNLEATARFVKGSEVGFVVFRNKEGLLASISTLSNMMRDTRDHDSWESRHTENEEQR